jgi:hypothetical protein
MARSHASASVRVRSGVARKQNGANKMHHQVKHNVRHMSRPDIPKHQVRQKAAAKPCLKEDTCVYAPTWRPQAPSRGEWLVAWPNLNSQQAILGSRGGSEQESVSDQQLTQLMKDMRSLDDLLNVIIRHGESFNHVHATAALGYLHSLLQRSYSKDSKPTYSVKMVTLPAAAILFEGFEANIFCQDGEHHRFFSVQVSVARW